MGVRGELFSTKVALQNRTYFFNVKENRLGDLYLNIVESKNRDEGGFERQSVILFADDLQEFLQGFDESLRVLEKAVREKRKGHNTSTYENRSETRSENRHETREEHFDTSDRPRRGRDSHPNKRPRTGEGKPEAYPAPRRSREERFDSSSEAPRQGRDRSYGNRDSAHAFGRAEKKNEDPRRSSKFRPPKKRVVVKKP